MKKTKRIKMMLYGAPGVGKSTFAFKFPKPFFITTDGNYEWLEDFGAKDEDHKQIESWSEFVSLIESFDFSNYETIVVDLLEDLYQWAENEFCKKNRIDHIGDLGFGKGYKMIRDVFFLEISKLLAKNKHIIILTHETASVVKDKRGVETTLYAPSKIVSENLRDRVEGRLRYVLRAKFKDVVDGDVVNQVRVLSLASDSSEFGIIRGIDMNTINHDIPLEFEDFAKEFKLNFVDEIKETKSLEIKTKPVETKVVEKATAPQSDILKKLQEKVDNAILKQKIEQPIEKPIEVSKPAINVSNEKELSALEKIKALQAKVAEIKNNKITSTEIKETKSLEIKTKPVETKVVETKVTTDVVTKRDVLTELREKIRLQKENK